MEIVKISVAIYVLVFQLTLSTMFSMKTCREFLHFLVD
jgi:hypothetical protein